MTTTTMHFGPEWMRTKQGSRPAASPPLANSPAPPGASSYSALVTPAANPPPERRDIAHPFRYSREDLLRIYKEGGGKGGLGLEVERWEGIVREVGCDPIGLKEMGEMEKKIFAGSLNSEIRRRQSTDYLSPLTTQNLTDRPKLNHAASGAPSPMRERLGGYMGRKRDDPPPITIPRKLSLSSMQGSLTSPREFLPSPRRIGQTSGFDGVLSESWSSKRRTSDALAKPSSGLQEREASDSGENSKEMRIKEEDEVEATPRPQLPLSPLGHGVSAGRLPGSQIDPPIADAGQNLASGATLNGSIASLSLSDQGSASTSNGTGATGDPMMSRPPPGLTDLTGVDWSYLDPQGQIQGPFRADIMQRWHDEGYFAANLLMKRTHLDSEWMTVGEMTRCTGGSPIFLTPTLNSSAPPGLSRRPDPLLEGPMPDRDRSALYQPVPTTSRRGSTLESFMHSGANSASASPASSFGAGRFMSNSPDPNAFDGRHLYSDTSAASRLAGFAAGPDSSTLTGQRRATLNDTFDPSFGARAPYSNIAPGRAMNNRGSSGLDGMTTSSADSIGPFKPNFGASDAASSSNGNFAKSSSAGFNGSDFGPIGGFVNQSRVVNRDAFDKPPLDDRLDSHLASGVASSYTNGPSFQQNGQSVPQNLSLQYSLPQDSHSLQSFGSMPDRQAPSMPVNQQFQLPFTPSAYANSQPNWSPQEASTLRRPGPFDPSYPTTSNLLPQPSYNRAAQNAALATQSPWHTPSPGVVNNGWGGEASSLTVANLGQHNQQHQEAAQNQAANDVNPPQHEMITEASHDVQPQPVTPAAAPSAPAEAPHAQKSSRKAPAPTSSATAAAAPPPAPKVTPSPPVAAPAPSPPPAIEHKPAWSTDDDKKGKTSGITLGLREIQEVETKKLEARKAAQRERERAVRVVAGASGQSEEFQTFTTSWGLPTSQAGTARATPFAVKEAPALASPTTAPVWTNAVKTPVAKKTMKEIQEEEEKRKNQAAKEKETVVVAARRGYAETTTKPSAAAQPGGGAWTTVGTAGKTSGVTPAAVRPTVQTLVSAKVPPSVTSASVVAAPPFASRTTVAVVPTIRTASVVKSAPSKADETPSPPSQEFLRWLSESLKGLNSTVHYEEITSMLLSFPIDPDSSTIEIISDLIYASSTTLDGRRFASEFVSKRKADVLSRPKGAPPSGAGKTLSIADVVKAQPKPAQNEWGGFKVVNKKKKGGRA